MGLGTKAFDPAQCIFTLGGLEMKGFAPGSKIQATFPEMYNVVVGLDGEVGRGKTNNRTSQWKVSLLQTSLSNDVLQGLFDTDDAAPGGTVFPLFYKNLNGTTIIIAATAWIVGMPEHSITNEVGVNEWTIQCGETITVLGGQSPVPVKTGS